MRATITASLFLALLLGLCLHAAPAQAQLSHTAVSALRGNDASNCAVATPCRTFQRAHDATNDQGEITVLDPGGYGALTTTKSISIVNDGVGAASILVSGGSTGITINAPAAGYVNLRGITIQGIGFGASAGIRFNTGFALTVTNCVIRNHTGDGLDFSPGASSTLDAENTLVADNGGHGIGVSPSGQGNVKVAFSRVQAFNNSQIGILVTNFSQAGGSLNAVIADSVANNNADVGFTLVAFTGRAPANLTVTRSVSANNFFGLSVAGSNGALRLGATTIMGNVESWF